MMHTHRSRAVLAAAALVLASAATRPASGATIEFTVPFDAFATPFEYPLFDPALGVLTDVTYSIVGAVNGFSSLLIQAVPREDADPNFDYFEGSFFSNFSFGFGPFRDISTVAYPNGLYVGLVTFTVQPTPEGTCQGLLGFDTECTAIALFDAPFDLTAKYQPSGDHGWNFDLPTIFGELTGVGTNTFVVSTQQSAVPFGLTNANSKPFSFEFSTIGIEGLMTVTYHFNADGNGLGPGGPGGGGPGDGGPVIPEPGTWTLLGLGLAGVALLRRRPRLP